MIQLRREDLSGFVEVSIARRNCVEAQSSALCLKRECTFEPFLTTSEPAKKKLFSDSSNFDFQPTDFSWYAALHTSNWSSSFPLATPRLLVYLFVSAFSLLFTIFHVLLTWTNLEVCSTRSCCLRSLTRPCLFGLPP